MMRNFRSKIFCLAFAGAACLASPREGTAAQKEPDTVILRNGSRLEIRITKDTYAGVEGRRKAEVVKVETAKIQRVLYGDRSREFSVAARKFDEGKFRTAARYYRKSLGAMPKCKWAPAYCNFWIAESLFRARDFKGYTDRTGHTYQPPSHYYLAAIKANPKSRFLLRACTRYGRSLVEEGQMDSAKKAFKVARATVGRIKPELGGGGIWQSKLVEAECKYGEAEIRRRDKTEVAKDPFAISQAYRTVQILARSRSKTLYLDAIEGELGLYLESKKYDDLITRSESLLSELDSLPPWERGDLPGKIWYCMGKGEIGLAFRFYWKSQRSTANKHFHRARAHYRNVIGGDSALDVVANALASPQACAQFLRGPKDKRVLIMLARSFPGSKEEKWAIKELGQNAAMSTTADLKVDVLGLVEDGFQWAGDHESRIPAGEKDGLSELEKALGGNQSSKPSRKAKKAPNKVYDVAVRPMFQKALSDGEACKKFLTMAMQLKYVPWLKGFLEKDDGKATQILRAYALATGPGTQSQDFSEGLEILDRLIESGPPWSAKGYCSYALIFAGNQGTVGWNPKRWLCLARGYALCGKDLRKKGLQDKNGSGIPSAMLERAILAYYNCIELLCKARSLTISERIRLDAIARFELAFCWSELGFPSVAAAGFDLLAKRYGKEGRAKWQKDVPDIPKGIFELLDGGSASEKGIVAIASQNAAALKSDGVAARISDLPEGSRVLSVGIPKNDKWLRDPELRTTAPPGLCDPTPKKSWGRSRATDSAIRAALRWLSTHQARSGKWDTVRYGGKPEDVATTSLATMAFLGSGHTEKRGRYRGTVRRSIAWLRSRQRNGKVYQEGQVQGVGYQHGIAALALVRAAAAEKIPGTVRAASDAVTYSTDRHQSSLRGRRFGWRYLPGKESDLCVSSWFIQHLAEAKEAGITVNREALAGAERFLASVRSGLRYGYLTSKHATVRRTAMGCVSRFCLTNKAEPLKPAITRLVREGGTPEWGAGGKAVDMLYWYYGTKCARICGGQLWKSWAEGLKLALVDNQRRGADEDGSWDPVGSYSRYWGRAGQTAFGCLCLLELYDEEEIEGLAKDPAPIPGGTGTATTKASTKDLKRLANMMDNYIRSGMQDMARQYAEKIIKQFPESAEAKRAKKVLGK